MDEDQDNGGLGGLAWYQMGRWSERSSQRSRDWIDSYRNPVIAKAHYDEAVRLNQAFADQDRRLNALVDNLEAQLNASRADYERLRIWANERANEAAAQAELAAHHAGQASSWKERYETESEQCSRLLLQNVKLILQLQETQLGIKRPHDGNKPQEDEF